MKSLNKLFKVAVISQLIVCVFAICAQGTLFTWTGAGNGIYWSDPCNWSPVGGPPGGEGAYINSSPAVTINSAHITGLVGIGSTVGGQGTLNISAGCNLGIDPNLTADPNLPSETKLGTASGATGNVYISDGNVVFNTFYPQPMIWIGSQGTGLWQMTGGKVSSDCKVLMGYYETGSSTLNIGGSSSMEVNDIVVGSDNGDPGANSGSGTINVSGGFLKVTDDLILGDSSNGSPSPAAVACGTLNMSGGRAIVSHLYLGNGADGSKVSGDVNLSGTAHLDVNLPSHEAASFYCTLGSASTGNISIKDNATLLYQPHNDGAGYRPFELASGGPVTLTISGNGKLLVPVSSFGVASPGDCNIVMTGGEIFGGYHTYFGIGSSMKTAHLNTRVSGGTITINGAFFIGQRYSDSNFVLCGGTVNAPLAACVGCDGGNGILTITSGTFTTPLFTVAEGMFGAQATGHVQMDGGTLHVNRAGGVGQSIIVRDGSYAYASIDMAGGEIIIDGDDRQTIQKYIDGGVITAYINHPAHERAVLKLEYDDVNNKTYLYGEIPSNLHMAWGPEPLDGQTNVDPLYLKWRKGDDALSHDVYLGTDYQTVLNAAVGSPSHKGNQADQPNNTFPLSNQTLGQTYYWRIDERDINYPPAWKGDVWEFTVADYLVVDDFQSYDSNTAIRNVWGNNASLETIADGNRAMYVGANTTVQRAAPFANWTSRQVKALDIWFHGSPNNSASAQQMYVTLTGTGGNATVYYEGDVNDIKQGYEDSYRVWHIDLARLSAADLNNITTLKIGVGGSTGDIVYFDNIRLYIRRCMPEMVGGDATGDCDVGIDDFVILGSQWQDQYQVISAVNPGTTNLVLHYKFDQSSGTTVTDSSGYGYTGYIEGWPVSGGWKTGGKYNNCLEFDGCFGVNASSGITTKISNAITLSVWIWSKTAMPSDYAGCIFHGSKIAVGASRGWFAECTNVERNVTFDSGIDLSASPSHDSTIYVPESSMEYGYKWNHWTFVKDVNSRVQRIYHNGIYVAENTDANNPISGMDTFSIGKWIGAYSGGYYLGKLDDFRIYNRALTQAEIVYLADLSSVAQPKELAADGNSDGKVDLKDLDALAEQWLLSNLLWPY